MDSNSLVRSPMINPKALVRNPDKVRECLREVSGKSLVAVKPVRIYIPAGYPDRDLANIGTETYIVGIFGIVTEEGYFGTNLVNAMVRIEPTDTNRIVIDGDEYFEFYFERGSTIIPNLDLVKTDTLVYQIFNEFVSKARVPWYIGYPEAGQLFDTAKKHAGANVGENHEVIELLISLIARDPTDRTKYYRQFVQSYDQLVTDPPAFVPLRSIQYSATNTINKLAGSYFHNGMVSALVTPTEDLERIDGLLRR